MLAVVNHGSKRLSADAEKLAKVQQIRENFAYAKFCRTYSADVLAGQAHL